MLRADNNYTSFSFLRSRASLSIALTAFLCAMAPCAIGRAGQPGKSPLKVFILAGQSNMEGHGKIEMGKNPDFKDGVHDQKNPSHPPKHIEGGLGSLRHLVNDPKTAGRYKYLVDAKGDWVVRKDVWIWSTTDRGEKGELTVGYGANEWIGPELGFGMILGDLLDRQVLIIKTSWGGKSLAVDFRPPSSGKVPFSLGKNLEAGIKKDPEIVGRFYRQMLKDVREVLDNLPKHFPDYDGRGYEIAGFGWHQGWNDGGNDNFVEEYGRNLVNLIRDLRKDLDAPGLPVVIANSGFGGKNLSGRRLKIAEAQIAAAKRPEFKGNVLTVETRGYWRPSEVSPSGFGYHWNHNGETHYLIGEAMGKAMADLLGIGDSDIKTVSN